MWHPQNFYNEYCLNTPTILMGEESVRGLYNFPASKIAVIHGDSYYDEDLFRETFSKRDIKFVKRSWQGEPDISGVAGTLHEIERFCPDVIIAVGGGSVIDGAKIVRLFFEYPFYRFGETRISGEALRTKFIAIPTTIGSGAEVSSAAIFVDHEQRKKQMIVIHELQPEVVIYDKRYVKGNNTKSLVHSILDAMAHILEGYVSILENSMMDVYAEKGFAIIIGEIEKIIKNNMDEIDYQQLQYAGFLGGIVQNHCIVGATHAFAHQLTDYGYSHSEAVSLLLLPTININAEEPKTNRKYSEIIKKAGLSTIEEFTNMIHSVSEQNNANERFDKLKNLLKDLSDNSRFRENVMNDRGGKGNPIPITDEYIDRFIGSL